MVETPRGNETKGVNIVVISDNTPYCPAVSTSTNKGKFYWPKSVSIKCICLCTIGQVE